MVPTVLSNEKTKDKKLMDEKISIKVDSDRSQIPEPNQSPYIPSNPNPSDNAIDISYYLDTLSWSGGDPEGDEVTYHIYLEDDNLPIYIGYTTDTFVTLSKLGFTNLLPETQYFWQIIADDGNGGVTEGPVWSFTTELSLQPYPLKTVYPIDRATNIPVPLDGEEFTFTWFGGDPNNDLLRYYIFIRISGMSTWLGTIEWTHDIPVSFSFTQGKEYSLYYNVEYIWYVIVEDGHGNCVRSDHWSFITEPVYDVSGSIYYNGDDEGILTIAAFADGIEETPVDVRQISTEWITFPFDYLLYLPNGEYYILSYIDVDENDELPNISIDPIGYYGLPTYVIITDDGIENIDINLRRIPIVTEAYSCAEHIGVTKDVKLHIDFDSVFGVIEPRDKYRNLNSNKMDLYIEVDFTADVDIINELEVIITPEPFAIIVVQNILIQNKIRIQFLQEIPNGIYHIQIKDIPSGLIIGEFNISYLTGDITGNGNVNRDDMNEIITNWQFPIDFRHISLTPNPRCDINRNGIIEGLDIARIFNSANWLEFLIL